MIEKYKGRPALWISNCSEKRILQGEVGKAGGGGVGGGWGVIYECSLESCDCHRESLAQKTKLDVGEREKNR